MRVGLLFDFSNPSQWSREPSRLFEETLQDIAWAESLGLESVWLTEHHFWEDGYLPSPMPIAAAIAARTSSVTIGTSVMLAPLHHPVRLAEEVALVDILSNGRIEIGVSIGWAADEFAAFGVPPEERVGRMGELVAIMKAAWSDEPIDHQGRYFTINNVSVTPKPVQQPPTIWGGGKSPAAGRRIGKLGLPLLWMDPPTVAAYLEGLEEGGHDPASARVGGFTFLYVADDPEEVWPTIRAQVLHQRARYARTEWTPGGRTFRREPPSSAEQLLEEGDYRVLTPAAAIRFIELCAANHPLDNIHFPGAIPGVPREVNRRHMQLVAEKIVPHFRSRDRLQRRRPEEAERIVPRWA